MPDLVIFQTPISHSCPRGQSCLLITRVFLEYFAIESNRFLWLFSYTAPSRFQSSSNHGPFLSCSSTSFVFISPAGDSESKTKIGTSLEFLDGARASMLLYISVPRFFLVRAFLPGANFFEFRTSISCICVNSFIFWIRDGRELRDWEIGVGLSSQTRTPDIWFRSESQFNRQSQYRLRSHR